MVMLPPGTVLITVLLAATAFGFLLVHALRTSDNRALASLGLKYARNSPGKVLAQSLPVALVIAVILSSLSVGDGLFQMVERNTDRNLAGVELMVDAPDLLPQQVLDRAQLGASALPVIRLDALASKINSNRNLGVELFGMPDHDEDFARFFHKEGGSTGKVPDFPGAFVNSALSYRLGITRGDRLRVVVDPDLLTESTLFGYGSVGERILNLSVEEVVEDRGIGRFREDAVDRVDPLVFVELAELQRQLGLDRHVNTVLLDTSDDPSITPDRIREGLDRAITASDGGMEIRRANAAGGYLVHSKDFFFDPEEKGCTCEGGVETLSYFVDGMSSDGGELSYSVIGSRSDMNLGPDEIMVSNWTAHHLGVGPSDQVNVSFRTVTPFGTLQEGHARFRVAGIYPMVGLEAEPALIPPIQGITDEASCASWDPSFNVNISSIQDDDLEYWNLYRTTPKAFISIHRARELWSISTGNTTAVWYPEGNVSILTADLNDSVTLSSLDASVVSLKQNALDSSRGISIFPAMFLTFGMVVLLASLLIMAATVRALSMSRARDWGMIRALGVKTRGVGFAGVCEAVPSLLAGSVLGVALGWILSHLVNQGLNSAWSTTVEGSSVPFFISPLSVVMAVSSGLLIALVLVLMSTLWETGRVRNANIARSDSTVDVGSGCRPVAAYSGIILTAAGLSVILLGHRTSGFDMAWSFMAGALGLASGITLAIYSHVSKTTSSSATSLMVTSNLARRCRRNASVALTMALCLTLASSLTVVEGMLVGGLNEQETAYGGGADFLVQTDLPFKGMLSSIEDELDCSVTAFLARGTEGGKCSNLNAPFPPRLLGVPIQMHSGLSFGLSQRDDRFGSDGEAWQGLQGEVDGKVPIMADINTLLWIYHENLGSTFTISGEDGEDRQLLVIGVLEPSVLTGSFVLGEDHLRELFPASSGNTFFLLSGETGGEFSGTDPDTIADAFDQYSPVVSLPSDLALENLEAEMSYLSLFRDYLLLGVVSAFAAGGVFAHLRNVGNRREMELLRSVGVGRKRALGFLMMENFTVFFISGAGAVGGTVVASVVLWSTGFGTGLSSDALLRGLTVVGSVLAVALVMNYISAAVSTRDYHAMNRRGE